MLRKNRSYLPYQRNRTAGNEGFSTQCRNGGVGGVVHGNRLDAPEALDLNGEVSRRKGTGACALCHDHPLEERHDA